MKKLKILILSLVVAGTVTSCRDENFGEKYNQDLYGKYDASYAALLGGAIQNFGTNRGGSYLMNPILYAQYQSQIAYTTESRYSATPGSWSEYYVNQILNLNKIIDDYSNNPTSAMLQFGSANNMIGVSKIFRAIIMKRVTDTYGDAPFSDAVKAAKGINTPKYDSQEDIYKNIFKDLKEGRDMLDNGLPPKGDVLYGGDLAKWKKLANSVILQSALQLSKKYPSASEMAAKEFNDALSNAAGVIENVDDEAWFMYNSTSLVNNPLTAYRAADYALSAELTESLKGSNNQYNRTSNHTPDERLSVYSNSGMTGEGVPYGYTTQNLPNFGTDNTKLSNNFNQPNSPLALMTASYTYLNRAEAAQLGWTSESAMVMLEKGIVSSYKSLDVNYGSNIYANASAYVSARLADAAGKELQVIGEEKWVSLFMNGHYAWSEWRRTGYPNLLPSPDAINGGKIPTRIQYPSEEANYNSVNYNKAVSNLTPGEDKNTSKFWWEL